MGHRLRLPREMEGIMGESRPPRHLSRREEASNEIADWMAGPGRIALGALVLVIVAAFLVSLVWP